MSQRRQRLISQLAGHITRQCTTMRQRTRELLEKEEQECTTMLLRWKATLLLFGLTVVVAAFLTGSVLSSFGMLPSTIVAATSAFGGTLAAILGVLGGLLLGSLAQEKMKEIWRLSYHLLAILSGIFLIGVVLLALFLNADPYLHRGMQVLNDPLRDNSHGYNWDIVKGADHMNTFVNGALHVSVDTQNSVSYIGAGNTHFSDFVYEAQMTILKGACGGLIFRQILVQSSPHFYSFNVCDDGSYDLYRYDAAGSSFGAFQAPITVYQAASASPIHTGLNQANLLAVAATSSGIELWVNGQHLVSLSETTYQGGGFIGVEVDANTLPTEVVFSNAKVWVLS